MICITLLNLLWFMKYFKNTGRTSHPELQKHGSVIIPTQLDSTAMPQAAILISYQEEDKLSLEEACNARCLVMSHLLKSSNLQ